MPKHISVTLDFIPVEGRLPDDCQSVWAAVHGQDGPIVEIMFEDGKWWCGSREMEVTHWAEIPELEA